MSGVRRTDNLHSIKTREIVLQNADGTFPAYNSVLTVIDNNGHVQPTRSLVLDSLICGTFSANFLGTSAPVRGLKIVDISAANIAVESLSVDNLSIRRLNLKTSINMHLLNVNATTTKQLILSYNNLLQFLESVGIVQLPIYPLTKILAASPDPDQRLLVSESNGESWFSYSTTAIQDRLTGFLDSTSGIIWGNEFWFAIGNIGISAEIVYATNTNVLEWTSATPISPYVFDGSGGDLGWNGQLYIATFKNSSKCVWTSSDGLIWIPNSTTITPTITSANRVFWNGNIWMLVGNDASGARVYTSLDGDTWTNRDTYNNNNFLNINLVAALDAAYDGTRWVVGGIRKPGAPSIYYSYGDVADWLWLSADASGDVFTDRTTSIAWNENVFVAVGSDTSANIPIMYSSNGILWKRVLSADIIDSSGEMFTKGTSVMWTVDQFVAVGTDGIHGYSKPAHSYDGIHWSTAFELGPPYPGISTVSHNFNTPGEGGNPNNFITC